MNNNKKLIYLLPNFFTAASCFAGVVAVIASINGSFSRALLFIFISLILDGLDGRVARLTNTTSKFGVEFDSLSDLVAFGVAPAVYFYTAVGHNFGKMGILVSALFVVFGAIRLARFNITTGTYEPNIFIGLPIPITALCLALWVTFYLHYGAVKGVGVILLLFALLLAFLMVSNIRYPSFKKIEFKKSYSMKILIFSIIFFGILYLKPLEFCLFLSTSYVVYGIARAFYNLFLAKKREQQDGE